MKPITIEIPQELAKAVAEVLKNRHYPDEMTEVYLIEDFGLTQLSRAENIIKDIINELEKET